MVFTEGARSFFLPRSPFGMGVTRREVNEARRPHICSRLCAFEKNNLKKKRKKKEIKKNPAAPATHHEIHSSPATATISRRRATKHVSRVNPYSPASSIDPGFVEIGLIQLSQSVNDECYIYTVHRQPDRHNGTLYAPWYEEAFLPTGTKRLRPIRFFGLASFLSFRLNQNTSKQTKNNKNKQTKQTKNTTNTIHGRKDGRAE